MFFWVATGIECVFISSSIHLMDLYSINADRCLSHARQTLCTERSFTDRNLLCKFREQNRVIIGLRKLMGRFGRTKKSAWNFFLVFLVCTHRAERNGGFCFLASWRIETQSCPALRPWHHPSPLLPQSGIWAVSFLPTQSNFLFFLSALGLLHACVMLSNMLF